MIKKYSPTESVLENMQRGLALNKKYNRESQAAQQRIQQVQKAKAIFDSKTFDLASVTEIHNTLSKLEKSLDFNIKKFDGGPTEEVIKYYAFGGKSGLAWSRLILKQEGILKSYKKDITEAETKEQGVDSIGRTGVIKSVDQEKRLATFVVLEPQDDDGLTTDAHGDTYTEDEVEKACHNFNRLCGAANLFHAMPTTGYEFVESYISKADMVIGTEFIRKGTWLATIYVSEDWIWEGIKDGTFDGLSIQCMGTVENLEE
jgi:Putative phage serine protease XkdF